MIPALELHEIHLGPIRVHIFGLLLVLGVIAGHMVLVRRARALRLATPWVIEGFAIALGAGAIIATYATNQLFGLGLSSICGLAGAIAAGATYTLALRLDVLGFADAAAYAFPFGWFLARLGCAAVHDHLGPPSSAFIAVRFPSGSRLDLGLIEALSTLILLAAVVAVGSKARGRPGLITSLVAIGYAVIRFPLDFLRLEDIDPRFAGLTVAQWGCFPLFAIGIATFALGRFAAKA